MIVSVTEIGQFLRCRQQWDYSSFNRQSLTPIMSKQQLALGSAMHKALELWTLNYATNPYTLEEWFLQVAAVTYDKVTSDYKAAVGTLPSDDEMQKFFKYIMKGQHIARNYQLRWNTPLPANFRLVQPEQQVIVPIPNSPHYLSATMDDIIADPQDRLYPVEHKTYSTRPDLNTLSINHQFRCYFWILRQLNIGRVQAIAYDGMSVDEKPTRGNTLDSLFLRMFIDFSDRELLSLEHELAAVTNDMANDPSIYRNFRWEGCWDCQMIKLCLAEYKNESPESTRKQHYKVRVQE